MLNSVLRTGTSPKSWFPTCRVPALYWPPARPASLVRLPRSLIHLWRLAPLVLLSRVVPERTPQVSSPRQHTNVSSTPDSPPMRSWPAVPSGRESQGCAPRFPDRGPVSVGSWAMQVNTSSVSSLSCLMSVASKETVSPAFAVCLKLRWCSISTPALFAQLLPSLFSCVFAFARRTYIKLNA